MRREREKVVLKGEEELPELLEGRQTRPPRVVHQFYITERRWKDEEPLEIIALRTDRYNLIHDRRVGTYELYNYRDDYLEANDLSVSVEHRDTFLAMKQQLSVYTFSLHKQ